MPLGVGWLQAIHVRLDPDLQEVQRLGVGWIEFRVRDSSAGAHELDLAGFQLTAISHTVFVRDGSGNNVAENFHFPMRMIGETGARCDDVLVDHTQAAEAHVGGIVVIREAEGVIAIQPTVIGVTAFG